MEKEAAVDMEIDPSVSAVGEVSLVTEKVGKYLSPFATANLALNLDLSLSLTSSSLHRPQAVESINIS